MTTIAGVLAAGWSDFVDPSRTALVEGTDWRGSLTILDGEGAPVDLSGGVFSCTVWDQVGGALLVTLTATGSADGTLTLSAPASETGGIVPGSALDPVWQCLVTAGGLTGAVWAPTTLHLIGQAGA